MSPACRRRRRPRRRSARCGQFAPRPLPFPLPSPLPFPLPSPPVHCPFHCLSLTFHDLITAAFHCIVLQGDRPGRRRLDVCPPRARRRAMGRDHRRPGGVPGGGRRRRCVSPVKPQLGSPPRAFCMGWFNLTLSAGGCAVAGSVYVLAVAGPVRHAITMCFDFRKIERFLRTHSISRVFFRAGWPGGPRQLR